jgi:hypothetical protein
MLASRIEDLWRVSRWYTVLISTEELDLRFFVIYQSTSGNKGTLL